MIKFTDDTPDWVKDWVAWTSKQLLPDWDINVKMVDTLDPDPDHDDFDEARLGEIEASSENLRAAVKFKRGDELKDDEDGHIYVVHELCHAFMCPMSESAVRLISTKVVKRTAWKGFEGAEENSVVRLSRLLVRLRMDGKT